MTVTGRRENAEGPQGCTYHQVDFSDRAAMERFAEAVKRLDFDILVNNAGINKVGAFDGVAMEDFDSIQQVNIRAPFVLCQAVLPGMRKKKWGRIVNISSIFGKISKELRGPYSASKFALDGMSVALAAEVAEDGILVNCVAPGFIRTDMTWAILGEKGVEEIAARVPMKRLGTPQEVAALVAWLVSPENTYITGQNIAIDGGFSRV